MRRPEPNQIFKHFKGNLYKIITIATHTETQEEMVVYQALYGDYQDFVRPLSMFMEEVDYEKYPKAQQKYRFEPVEESKEEGFKLDPMVEAYLDADNCKDRLEILESIQHRITDDMITTMAIVSDFEIP